MDHCAKHPDRQTPYRCMKHGIAMCKECMHCRDPEIYCKDRSSCAIHFLQKNGDDLDKHSVAQDPCIGPC